MTNGETFEVPESSADRYRRRADAFGRLVTAVSQSQWADPTPCEKWSVRDLVDHVIAMNDYALEAAGLEPTDDRAADGSAADDRAADGSAADDVAARFEASRAAVESLFANTVLIGSERDSPGGRMTLERYLDEGTSDDVVLHGWDLARAIGQDDTIHPIDVERLWTTITAVPEELMAKYRTPGAFGPDVEVFGPLIEIAEDASLQDRLLGLIGRDPAWTAPDSGSGLGSDRPA